MEAPGRQWHTCAITTPTNVPTTGSRGGASGYRRGMITGLDFIGIPSTDAERSRRFYLETLGLRADEGAQFEFWVGETCCAIWEPAKNGFPFAPNPAGTLALHVEDIAAARSELEGRGVQFLGDTFDTGVCHMALFADPDGNGLMLHHRHAS